MKTRMIYPFVIILAIASFASCQNNGLSDLRQIQGFPNKVGDSWTYAYTDTAYGHREGGYSLITDTLKLSIVESKNGVTIWQTIWPKQFRQPSYRNDSALVRISGDSVKVSYLEGYAGFLNSLYIFPLETGNSWSIYADSSHVASKGSLSVPAGSFDNVYRISTGGGGVNAFFAQDAWFKPGVGIIQVTHYEFNNPGTYTLKLIDYHLK